jgi:hypothetical protein
MADTVPRPTENANREGHGAADPLVLHRWRLLDWRFLLPDPQPWTVGYGGATESAMEGALRLLDPDAVLIEDEDGTSSRTFQVVLLSYPDSRLFQAAIGAVQPGGWLCVRARRSLGTRRGPRTLLGWQRHLRRHGFQDVCVNWHAPTLDFPTRIVSVGSRAAVLDTLRRHKGIRFGRMKQCIGRMALNLGLFAAAIPEGTVTGRRPVEANMPRGHP